MLRPETIGTYRGFRTQHAASPQLLRGHVILLSRSALQVAKPLVENYSTQGVCTLSTLFFPCGFDWFTEAFLLSENSVPPCQQSDPGWECCDMRLVQVRSQAAPAELVPALSIHGTKLIFNQTVSSRHIYSLSYSL